MGFYIDVSMEITRLLNRYVPKEAIHVYSIDESFIDLEGRNGYGDRRKNRQPHTG